MSPIDSPPAPTCGRTSARRGFVLVLVIAYIALTGSLILMVTASTGQLIRTGANAHASILLRQLIDSGRAWADAHPEMPANTPVTLDPADILPPGASGTVVLTPGSGSPETVTIEARLGLHGRPFTRTAAFPVSSS